MRFIVDANIVFSAILNTNGKIGDILINGGMRFDFIAPEFLRYEIKKHYGKLMKISGLTIEEIAAKDVPVGKPFKIVDVADIPTDRTFRNAWEYTA